MFFDLFFIISGFNCFWFMPKMGLVTNVIITIGISCLVCFKHKFIRNAIRTLPRDLKGVYILFTLEYDIANVLKRRSTVASIFCENVKKFPNKIAYVDIEQNKKLTFIEMNKLTNQVANYFKQQAGLHMGDVVALFMYNSVDYIALWLGLSKLGVTSALINYNLRSHSLGHCVSVSKAKYLIVDPELQPAVQEAVEQGHISRDIEVLVYGGNVLSNFSARRIDDLLIQAPANEPSKPNDLDLKSVLLYIYTSGTTGLPKAAVLTNARFYMLTKGAIRSFGIKSSDRIYVSMPLYHTLSGVAGAGISLIIGSTVVIRKKFSASRFWDDCVANECTVGQYIGEICRYLLAQPVRPSEKCHKIRMMFGNGLRKEIWEDFTRRFAIKKIGELYASTEGNTSLVNIDNKVGACGFFPVYPYVYLLYPIALVKIDEETGEIVRNKNGLCVRCRPGEYGEVVGKIIKGNPVKEFQGYLSERETNKKLIRDVFNKGDVAFSSGDILYMDEMGYLYFKDRTGDTFRWKGENVSTREVEGVIHRIVGLNDASVFGVDIPGCEGKAGMAAIVDVNENTNLQQFNEELQDALPSYARPVFLRLCKEVEVTGTYKLQKKTLQQCGYNPSVCGADRLFYLNSKSGQYELLTKQVYDQITKRLVSF